MHIIIYTSVFKSARVLLQYKAKVREEQHEREKEQNSHGLMLRELQTLLTREKSAREEMQEELQDLRFANSDLRQVHAQRNNDDDDDGGLTEEMKKLESQLQCNETQRSRLADDIKRVTDENEQLRKELQQAKVFYNTARLIIFMFYLSHVIAFQTQYSDTSAHEQERLALAQTMLQEVSSQSENRISSLESRIGELSTSVGEYERTHAHDLQTIGKLKERIDQLDIENAALTQVSQQQQNSSNSQAASVDDLTAQISVIFNELIEVNRRSEKPLPVSGESPQH